MARAALRMPMACACSLQPIGMQLQRLKNLSLRPIYIVRGRTRSPGRPRARPAVAAGARDRSRVSFRPTCTGIMIMIMSMISMRMHF